MAVADDDSDESGSDSGSASSEGDEHAEEGEHSDRADEEHTDHSSGGHSDETPSGGVETGGESTAGMEAPWVFGLAAVAGAAAVGAAVYRRRSGAYANG